MSAKTTNRGVLDKLLSPTQRQSVVESVDGNQLIYLWTGSVSGGKTFASLLAFFAAVPKAPTNALIVIVGRSLLTIERNILDPMMSVELFGPLAQAVHHTTGSSTAVILGRTVHLVGASDSRSEGRIRGATIGLAMVDEATLVPQAFWMMLMSRLRVAGAKCLATTNPDAPGHWLRKDFILRAAKVGMRIFEFRLHDNPSLEPQYVETLKAQYVGLWYRRFILGEWSVAEGAVFDMFDPDKHVIGGDLPPVMMIPGVGVDYGTTNAFAALMLGIAAPDVAAGLPTRLVLTRELRHDPKRTFVQKTDAQFSADLRAWIGDDRPEWIAVDPSASSFKVQLFHDGIDNVVNARNDVIGGIRMFGSLLHAGHLQIHESCTGLLDELPGYSWDPDAALRGEDKPVKVDDHSCDAARYAVATTESLWRHLLPAAA